MYSQAKPQPVGDQWNTISCDTGRNNTCMPLCPDSEVYRQPGSTVAALAAAASPEDVPVHAVAVTVAVQDGAHTSSKQQHVQPRGQPAG